MNDPNIKLYDTLEIIGVVLIVVALVLSVVYYKKATKVKAELLAERARNGVNVSEELDE